MTAAARRSAPGNSSNHPAPGHPASNTADTAERLLGEVLRHSGSDWHRVLERICLEHGDQAAELRRRFAELQSVGLAESAGPERIGGYKILDKLGEGGMGTVYLAEQTHPVRRRVAIKVIRIGMDSRPVLARFERERQALAMMNHAAIAEVYEAGATELGQPYLVMELVEGMPLTDYCDRNRLSLADRIRVFQQVCRGVQHAHQKGVLHRDIKPGNILVSQVDEQHVVKIIDFGLARETGDPSLEQTMYTVQGQLLGTPEYMSPEQAAGRSRDIDTRTDIYSLGVVLYELLTGQQPFSTAELRQAGFAGIQRILDERQPPKPSTKTASAGDAATQCADRRRLSPGALLRMLRGDLDWIVMRAMAKEPERRYDSAAELAQDLERFLRSEPVHAGPPGHLYRLSKMIRKYRVQFVAGALVFTVLVAGIITSLGFYVRSEAQRRRAVAQEARALEQERRAKAEVDRFDRLSVVVKLDAVDAELNDMLPAWPHNAARMEQWLREKGDPLARELVLVRRTLRELEIRFQRTSPAEVTGSAPIKPSDVVLRDTMRSAADRLVAFTGESGALIQVRRRLRWARSMAEFTRGHPGARATWAEAAAAITAADGSVASRLYRDRPLVLKPQTGLVPIGMNPRTKLWEFYHLRSAYDPRRDGDPARIEIPTHRPDGSIEVGPGTGIVFVLIPGGTFTMGAQSADSSGTNYDELARRGDTTRTVELDSYFLARHELTQGQWLRLSLQANPSHFDAGRVPIGGCKIDLRHPVEQVDWFECHDLMRRHGLSLPRDTQWEYACRAGSDTPWCPGRSIADLESYVNLLDKTARRWRPNWPDKEVPFSDGYVQHSPVGAFRPNPYGMYDMHGNVREWCQDRITSSGNRLLRGGSYFNEARFARSAHREEYPPKFRYSTVGLRAARAVER